MSDVINFPDNFSGHLRLGELLFLDENFSEASDHFEQAYNLEDSHEANFFLVRSLVQEEKYAKALSIANEHLDYYRKDTKHQEIYNQLLLSNCFIISARLFSIQYIEETSLLKKMFEETERLENYLLQYEKVRLNKSVQTLLETIPREHEQAHFFVKLDQLPLKLFLKVGQQILVNDQYTIFVRNHLLEKFILLKVDVSIEIIDFEEEKQLVVPSELSEIQKEPLFQVINKELEELTSSVDELTSQSLIKENQMYLDVLSPFIQKWIPDEKRWIHAFLWPYKDVLLLQLDWLNEEELQLEFALIKKIQRKVLQYMEQI